jgi:SAM-dependent methyltransferase
VELLIGAGSKRVKQLASEGRREWSALVTLDINPDHKPDVVWDLNKRPLPFEDSTFDEIHAYDVLEHLGRQGDYRSFFDEWSEWWRILKPDGILFGISPAAVSVWAWGDPGHTRIVSPECLTFLSQDEYIKQIGISPMTDYRFCYKADFEPLFRERKDHAFLYAMQAVKPSRINVP